MDVYNHNTSQNYGACLSCHVWNRALTYDDLEQFLPDIIKLNYLLTVRIVFSHVQQVENFVSEAVITN